MSETVDSSLLGLDDCGCCEGITVQTPVEIVNRPGLSAISRRVGTYGQFKQSMLARLSSPGSLPACNGQTQGRSSSPFSSALRKLKTRDNDDFTIALLDAWAMVADVLTFYQERIANEAYLRTATEQLSLLYLARRISYELRPAAAANTYLAFTIEDAPGTPGHATIDVGTKVQSLPNPGEQPQVFETIETLEDARAAWNAMKPRMIQQRSLAAATAAQNTAAGAALNGSKSNLGGSKGAPSPTSAGADQGSSDAGQNAPKSGGAAVTVQDSNTADKAPDRILFLDGMGTGLKPGDGLLIVSPAGNGNHAVFHLVLSVTTQPKQKWTKVGLQELPNQPLGPAPQLPQQTGGQTGQTPGAAQQPAQSSNGQLKPTDELKKALGMLPPSPLTSVVQTVLGFLPQGIADPLAKEALNLVPEDIRNRLEHPAAASHPSVTALPKSVLDLLPSSALTTLPPVTLALLEPHLPPASPLSPVIAGVSNATKLILQTSHANGSSSSAAASANGSAPAVSTKGMTPASPEKIISSTDLQALAQLKNFKVQDIINNVGANAPKPPGVYAFRARSGIFGHNAPKFESLAVTQRVGDIIPNPATAMGTPQSQAVLQFLPGPFNGRDLSRSWVDDVTLAGYPNVDGGLPTSYVYLDNAYPGIVRDSWVVLRDSDGPVGNGPVVKAYQVAEATELSHTDFSLTAKVSRIKVTDNAGLEQFSIRKTTVFAQSEELKLAAIPLIDPATGQPTTDPLKGQPLADPITRQPAVDHLTGEPLGDPIKGQQIDLNGIVDGLVKGQTMVLCGELQNNRGNMACEVTTIDSVDLVYVDIDGTSFTRITLSNELNNAYVNSTVTINANVVRATHGDTIQSEVLGSGDASQPFQRFTLRSAPLTYITAPGTPSGVQSTLKVYVNDIEWHEVSELFGHGPRERVFTTRTDASGKTVVQFGDGITGVRLPTGRENVRATYRKGSGPQGAVKAGQLSLLLTRPLGVKSVTNPLEAEGFDVSEVGNDARRNAALTVKTLNRLVSLQDYEDFALAYVGISKAKATTVWIDQVSTVFITVVAPKGDPLPEDGSLLIGLLLAMQSISAPHVPLRIASYSRALFRLAARVKLDPLYAVGEVLGTIVQALKAHFSTDARSIGQAVTLSEVIATIQHVSGVIAVDVYRLYRYNVGDTSLAPLDAQPTPDFGPPPQRLDALPPHVNADGSVAAAELLWLDAAHLEVWE